MLKPNLGLAGWPGRDWSLRWVTVRSVLVRGPTAPLEDEDEDEDER
jgi:hypothetical protein